MCLFSSEEKNIFFVLFLYSLAGSKFNTLGLKTKGLKEKKDIYIEYIFLHLASFMASLILI